MKRITVIGGVAMLTLAVYFAWPEKDKTEPVQPLPNVAKVASVSDAVLSSEGRGNWPPASPDVAVEPKRVPIEKVSEAKSAAQSLAETRYGDPRTPPIQRSEATEQPNAAELADPKLYQQYETRQNMKLYAAFVDAAKTEVPNLRADIERGRAMGIPPEKIAIVEEKARRIEAMQAQLLREHPTLQKN